MQRFGRNRHGPKIGGSASVLGSGLGFHQHKIPLAEADLHTKWHLDAVSRLTTIEMGQKLGTGAPPPFWEGRGWIPI